MRTFSQLISCIFVVLLSFSACGTTEGDGQAANQLVNVRRMALVSEVQLLPLNFQLSGGLAGRVESLDITADGRAIWTDMRNQTTLNAKLSPSDLVQLRAVLAGIAGVEIAADRPRFSGRCRDCFEYCVTLSAIAKPWKIEVSSDRLAASAYRELIAILLSISDDVKRKNP